MNPVMSKPLNEGQQLAVNAFFEFLFSDDKEFNISGAAGTGKTHAMSYIIDETMPRYHETCKLMGITPEYDEVVMTATTNKAAEVLAESTGRPTSTIHSFLSLKVVENFSDGTMKLIKTGQWKVHERKIIFIDECSMIDTKLWEIIHEGTQNCKIVYVGDHSQLAPVQEKLSPIYRHDTPFYVLTQPMRNAGQVALMDVCQQLRDTVETGVFQPIQIVPGVIDHYDGDQMQAKISEVFQRQTQEARILAYTNRRVMDYNNHIRGERTLPVEFQPGELLINASAIKLGSCTLPVEAGVEIIRNRGASKMLVAKGVEIDVNHLDFIANCGERFSNVPIAIDRNHYDALVKYYAKTKNWDRYFFLKQTFVDLRPRDAATVHKSQGSTYDSVFIDLETISTCNIADQVARMLYVAFSRARSRIYLYGDLAQKYGGLAAP